ncbi:MAG: TolC family protein, partial [Candidatus Cloacimonetes bacterium]|nr:TolC family protein [Candidatus Cloacimonadota bacterium]
MKRIVITGMLLGAALLFGQPASRILSLEQARELALANNSAYQARQAELESSRWSKASALGNFLPTLTLDGSLLYMDPEPTYMAGNTVVSLNNDYRTLSLSLS